MKPIPLYSLVIFPTPEQSEQIKAYKQLLKNHIGWYGSANAWPHITVINFEDDVQLIRCTERIREFCQTAVSQNVTLNTWDSFGERTFFIAPDATSQNYLNQLIIDLHQLLGFNIKTAHAHLSIARGLDASKMKKAYALFKDMEVNFQFSCDAFYLRKFNDQTKQYSDIVEKMSFGK
jgi:hypothetical protein